MYVYCAIDADSAEVESDTGFPRGLGYQPLYTVFVYCTTDAESAEVDGDATFPRGRGYHPLYTMYIVP